LQRSPGGEVRPFGLEVARSAEWHRITEPLHNSEQWRKSVDWPQSDSRHSLLIEVINKWDSGICTLLEYLVDVKQYPGWLSRGLVEAYMSWRSEATRLRRVEYIKDAKGQAVEQEAMQGWYNKYYPHGIGFDKDRKPSGFAEFYRLLDEHPA
jgi:hypothetical protein